MPTHGRLFLHPCGLSAHREPHELSTVLGSCVSVCLHDPRRGCGGMNHYMLPLWNGEGLPTPKYGNVALDHLLSRMEGLGADLTHVVAKVFGGARVLGADMSRIGDRNIQVALDVLAERGIPVVAQDVGGTQARKLIFDTSTGVVLVSRLQLTASLARQLPQSRS